MAADQTTELAQLADDFWHAYVAFYPTVASSLGLHAYDGQITDLRSEAIRARVEALRGFQARLARIDPAALVERPGSVARLDYELLAWQIGAELWRWNEECDYRRNPLVYAYDAMVDSYIKRDYAHLEERAAALARHLRAIPTAMEVARNNLESSLPRPLIEEALGVFPGLVRFLTESLPPALEGAALPPALAREVWAARDGAVAALEGFIAFLRDDRLPASHEEFALGAERFAAMLRANELIDLPLDRLLAIGEADLARNQAAIAEVAARRDPQKSVAEQMRDLGRDHPRADELLAATRAMLEGLRAFLVERDLVTLPSEVRCRVEPTPPFARWAFAMMDTAGPFETTASESFYYITLPEPDWSPEQTEGWLSKFDTATLVATSIHEAYPGHYTHFLHINRAPSRLARTCWSYSHVESWAHYAEQMMLDEGYGNGDLRLRLAQLAEALVRNCRYVCAILMHTQGMSIAEATRFFMRNAYMDPVTAEQEARRGTHDPGYLNYTLGKLLLLKLRDDYRAAQGANFRLKGFHDAYIGVGAPPIPLLRRLLLPQHDGAPL